MLMLEIMMLSDGTDTVTQKYAKQKLLGMGLIEPEDDSDKQFMEQAAQAQQEPDALMVAAQAEMAKGQADQMDAETKKLTVQVDQFEAETARMKVMIEAQAAGMKLDMDGEELKFKGAETLSKIKLNMAKAKEATTLVYDASTGAFAGG